MDRSKTLHQVSPPFESLSTVNTALHSCLIIALLFIIFVLLTFSSLAAAICPSQRCDYAVEFSMLAYAIFTKPLSSLPTSALHLPFTCPSSSSAHKYNLHLLPLGLESVAWLGLRHCFPGLCSNTEMFFSTHTQKELQAAVCV